MQKCEDCGVVKETEKVSILADGIPVGEHDLCQECRGKLDKPPVYCLSEEELHDLRMIAYNSYDDFSKYSAAKILQLYDVVEKMQKTFEQIANTEWHPNADLVNVEIAYEMRAFAKEVPSIPKGSTREAMTRER